MASTASCIVFASTFPLASFGEFFLSHLFRRPRYFAILVQLLFDLHLH